MYTFESRVRFSEVDREGVLTLPALVNYFQDCSIFQSEELGIGIRDLKERGRAWVLSTWQIEVFRYPGFGERIETSTWATKFQGMFGSRNFQMKDGEGRTVARANTLWVFMDVEKGHPVRPDEEDIRKYSPQEPLDMERVPRKIALAEQMHTERDFPVHASQIDTNGHVNNCQYIQMALEVLPECARAQKIRVEYKKSAVYGDRIFPRSGRLEDRKIVELGSGEGLPFATVEFKENGLCV